jgi:RNase P/RNase MRP subunit p30
VAYYDIALQSCNIGAALESSLGFKRIFRAGKDVALMSAGKKGNFRNAIVSGTNKEMLAEASRTGARALVIEDMRIDRSLMDTMVKKGTLLCMPMRAITSREGLDRSKEIFLMRGMFDYAKHRGMHVAFVSLAASCPELCSSMQLIEFARLLGADEQYARYSISTVNREIANGNED